jgi:IS5 family transposase
MKQMSFADAEYAGKRKQTRRERFLLEMDQVVPWKGLIALIEPYYPKGDGGRPAYPLMAMLRVHLMQNWFGYSDPAKEALYETTILRQFSGLQLDRIPDETRSSTFGACWKNMVRARVSIRSRDQAPVWLYERPSTSPLEF